MSKSLLFSPFTLREVTFRNRVFVSPMCQYSSDEGAPTDWHLVHLGSRAVGGAGLVMAEATAVTPEGRISPDDSGIWSDDHVAPFRRIAGFIEAQGAVPAMQLAHAGRKASTDAPWRGGGPVGEDARGWTPVAPSPVAFAESHPVPHALEGQELGQLVEDFVAAARRALDAGFKVIELHAAHGYLLHEFLSPLSNRREDDYGGSIENRPRRPLRVVRRVRWAWRDEWPLFVRIAAAEWVGGGGECGQSVKFSGWLKGAGVDLGDATRGGLSPMAVTPAGPGFQVPFAERIRTEAGIATGAVGVITDPLQAEHIVRTGQADAVLMAREFLRAPYWPLHAARELGADVDWPPQYERAKR